MLKMCGKRIAVLLAASLVVTSLPAAAAVSGAGAKEKTPLLTVIDEATPSEWEETKDEILEKPEQTPGFSSISLDPIATDPELEQEDSLDPDSVPTDVTEWSFGGTSGIVQATMEGNSGYCGEIYIDAEHGKAAPRDTNGDTQINAGTILYIPVAGVTEELLGRQIVLHVQPDNGVAFTAEIYDGSEDGEKLNVVSQGNYVYAIDYTGSKDVYVKLTVGGTGSAYFTFIEVVEQREDPVGPQEAPTEFPSEVNFADGEIWPAREITEEELIQGLYFDPADGTLRLRGNDLMGHGSAIYIPLKGGVEADVSLTVYEGTVLEVAGESYEAAAGSGWPTLTVLENYTAEKDEWLAVALTGGQNYIRSISIDYAEQMAAPDGSVTEWLFDGSEEAFSGSLEGESDYYNHLFIDASEGKCEARPTDKDTQVSAGTWIWVPVSGKGELVLTSYANSDTVIVANGQILEPAGAGYTEYSYIHDSNRLEYVAVYFQGGSYLKQITFIPEAGQVTAGVEVWDMGGAEPEEGTGYMDDSFWDGHGEYFAVSTSNPEKYVLQRGEISIGSLILNVRNNDRVYYGDGTYSYGTTSEGGLDGTAADGENFGGAYYSNGSGRTIVLENLTAGTQVTFYMNSTNGAEGRLTFADGDLEAEIVSGDILTANTEAHVFQVQKNGTYTLSLTGTGETEPKLALYRVVKNSGCLVEGAITVPEDFTYDNFDLYFVPQEQRSSGIVYQASVLPEGSGFRYEAALPEGVYQPVLANVLGYGFASGTMITVNDSQESVVTNLEIVAKPTVSVSGTISGFESGTDFEQAGLIWVPENELQSPAVMVLTSGQTETELTFEGVLDTSTGYTAVLTGLDDYQITSGGSIETEAEAGNLTISMTVGKKAFYPVKGSLLHLPTETEVTSLTFTEIKADGSQGQIYSAQVQKTADGSGQTYETELRDGIYQASMITADGWYETETHATVAGGETVRDLYVSFTGTPDPIPLKTDLYVGYPDRTDGFATVTEAMKAAEAMRLSDEETRITIHLYPGTYREQVTVDVPGITLVNDYPEQGEAKITWYYGIGYEYYSVGEDGFYDPARAYDKYEKNEPASWGGTVYLTENADGFRAEHIVFENSFNDYVTEEEIEDGVSLSHSGQSSISFERTLGADVMSRAATERAAALLIYADQTEFYDCEMLSSQDTLYTDEGTEGYFKYCLIEGNTDYIFGYGDYYFDQCTLSFCGYSDEASGGYITAAREPMTDGGGYLFESCSIVRNTENGALHAPGYFGRPWGDALNVTFVNSVLESADVIAAEGWHEMSGWQPNGSTCHEYGTVADGSLVDVTGRVEGTVLTETEAETVDQTPEAFFTAGWMPEYADKEEDPGTGEVPGEGEDPGTGEVPGEGEDPGTGEVPGEGEDPGTGEVPGEGEDPGTGEEPGGSEDPGEGSSSDSGSYSDDSDGNGSNDIGIQTTAWTYCTAGTDGTWSWDAAAGTWSFRLNGGGVIRGQWAAIREPAAETAGEAADSWYYFDWSGNLQAGWLRDNSGVWYYLNPRHDGTFGLMLTGWQEIDGQWYYFNPESDGTRGAMYAGRRTPDGYQVQSDGQWDGQAAVPAE